MGKAVEEAEREVRKIIASVPAIECEELRLPSRYVGPLIGRGGDNIRGIMDRTRAKIDVSRGSEFSLPQLKILCKCLTYY